MKKEQEDQSRAQQAAMEELQRQLRPRFKDLPYEVPLFLFTFPGKNDQFSQATRFLIRVIREICPKRSRPQLESGTGPYPSL